MKKLVLAIFIACAIMAPSCKKIQDDPSGTNQNDESTDYDLSYQYKDGVIIYDEISSDYILKVEADTILYFSDNTPEKYLPKVNGIVTSGIQDNLPYGLGNKVLTMEKVGDQYKCVTTGAPLDEIFEELELRGSFFVPFDAEDGGLYDDEGQFWEAAVMQKTKTDFNIGGLLSINLNKEVNVENGKAIYAEGSFFVGIKCNFDISITNKRFDFYIELSTGLNGGFGAKRAFTLPETKIFKKKNIMTGVVAFGPVVLKPHVDLEVSLEGEVTGSVGYKFEKMWGVKAGLKNSKLFYENTSSKTDNSFVKHIHLNAGGEIAIICEVDFGAELYTDNINVELEPSVKFGLGTEIQVDDPDLIKNDPQLELKVSAELEAELKTELLGYAFEYEVEDLVSFDICSASWSLFPKLVDNTLNVERVGTDVPVDFIASYKYEGGLLNRFIDMYPTFQVYKGDNSVLSLGDNGRIVPETKEYTFKLNDLEDNVSYTGKAGVEFLGSVYNIGETIFSAATPTVAITRFEQTSAEKGQFTYNGSTYGYKFGFDVTTEIKGSEHCSEWGLYTSSSTTKHNPNEIRDGRVVQHWTGFATVASSSNLSIDNMAYLTPYAILKDTGERLSYESRTVWFSYNSSTKGVSFLPDYQRGSIVLRLDSISYE